jgi:predicted RNase H-like HicB family nuclease
MGADVIRRTQAMQYQRFTAIIEREGDGFVSLCPELDVASQGDTIEEARDNLAEAIGLLLEVAPSEEIQRRLRSEVFVTQVSVALA